MAMTLYTCGLKGTGPKVVHPCSTAVQALDKAGYSYDHKTVEGYRLMPWTWRKRFGGARDEVERLSGTKEVPILVLDDGEVISGSSRIARWCKEHPAAR
jgi:glutathione S-transferase